MIIFQCLVLYLKTIMSILHHPTLTSLVYFGKIYIHITYMYKIFHLKFEPHLVWSMTTNNLECNLVDEKNF